MAEPPSESPTLGHDPTYPAELQAPSTPLDTVTMTHDADFSAELSTPRQRIREESQRLRVLRQRLLREMAEWRLRGGTEFGRARIAEETSRLDAEIRGLLRELARLGIQTQTEFENPHRQVLWWSRRGEPQGCCVHLSPFHDSQIPADQLESHIPRVCISISRPGGHWELDHVYVEPRVISMGRGRSYLVCSFSIWPGLPRFFYSSQLIGASPDNR